MDLFARTAFLATAVSSSQEFSLDNKATLRELDVTCLLTDIAFSLGSDNNENMGEDGSTSESLLYIMHGNHVDSGGKMYFVGTT